MYAYEITLRTGEPHTVEGDEIEVISSPNDDRGVLQTLLVLRDGHVVAQYQPDSWAGYREVTAA